MPARTTAAYLSCAEPSWAGAVSERQLRGLLTLAALLSERVYLSDVHVGDNVNFLGSYLAGSRFGLYHHVRSLAEAGVVGLLLRTESFRPHAAVRSVECDSFADVYRSWRIQDPAAAWIVPPDDEVRLRFLADVDRWAGPAIVRYDYVAVKHTFMDTVRGFVRSGQLARYSGGWFDAVPGSHADYERLLERDWFSLADFYQFFQSRGASASHPLMLVHGLMNETAYSARLGSSLVGADLYGEPMEEVFWPAQDRRDAVVESDQPLIQALLERAAHVLDAPALSVLGLISGEEVATLRDEQGRGYFETLHLVSDPAYLQANPRSIDAFSRALAQYWEAIADHLRRNHPEATHRPRKLAMILGAGPGPLRRASKDSFSFALNVGVPVAAAAGALPAPVAPVAKELATNISLRFLFLAESQELKRIRNVIPNGSWFTKANPAIFPPGSEAA